MALTANALTGSLDTNTATQTPPNQTATNGQVKAAAVPGQPATTPTPANPTPTPTSTGVQPLPAVAAQSFGTTPSDATPMATPSAQLPSATPAPSTPLVANTATPVNAQASATPAPGAGTTNGSLVGPNGQPFGFFGIQNDNDPNEVGSSAWAFNQTYGNAANQLANMHSNPQATAGWNPSVVNAVEQNLATEAQGYSPDVQSQLAQEWANNGFGNYAAAASGNPAAAAAWNAGNPAAQQSAQAANGFSPSGYSTLQGGQSFTDPTKAAQAKTAIDAQVASGGGPLFSTAQPGGSPTTATTSAPATPISGILQQILNGGGQTDANIPVIDPFTGNNLNPPINSTGSSNRFAGALNGGANDTGGSSTTAPPTTTAVPGSATGSTGQSSTGNSVLDALLNGDAQANNGAVSTTATDPNNPLTGQTISVGSQNDPVQMALSAYNTFRQSTDPQYQADLRDAVRSAAAGGAIGSGSLNTSLGNIANTRQNTLATEEQSLLNNALGTQNENAYRNVGIAQQQQGFQNQQEQEAVQNALQQFEAGNGGDPSQLGLALSAIFGQQASQAGNNLGSLISGTSQSNSTNQLLQQILGMYGGSAGASGTDPQTQAILDGILNGGVPGVQTTPGGGY